MAIGLDTLLRRIVRTGLRRGLGGEGWPWLALALGAAAFRRARRRDRPSATIPLRPGDRYVVELLDPPGGSSGPSGPPG